MAGYPVGDSPQDLQLVDLDGDGKLDIVTANRGDATLSVLRGRGDGTFQAATSLASLVGLDQIVVTDVNNDGRLDIVGRGSANVMVMLGTGGSTFGPATLYAAPAPTDLVVVDYNRDSFADVLTIDNGAISALTGSASGVFTPVGVIADTKRNSSVLKGGTVFAAADLNNNGMIDFAIGGMTWKDFYRVGQYTEAPGVAVFYGPTNATSPSSIIRIFSQQLEAVDIAIGNFTSDGYPDIVLTKPEGYHTIEQSSSGFRQAYGYAAPGTVTDVIFREMNGDSLPDAVVATGTTDPAISTALNPNSGSFGHAGLSTIHLSAQATGIGAGDLNGDGVPDVVVSLGASDQVVTILNDGFYFDRPFLATQEFGAGPAGGGWTNDDLYPRRIGDVNGDGRADLVVFGEYGVSLALGRTDGTFAPTTGEIRAFGHDANSGGLTSADRYPRELADVNGDGRADIVGFGDHAVYVSLAQADGHFANPLLAVSGLGTSGGWTSQDETPRRLGDVNGDGKADIVGFGRDGVYVALATGNGLFAAPTFQIAFYGANTSGWVSDTLYPRLLGDINGDGRADIVGLRTDGGQFSNVYVSYASATGSFTSAQTASHSFGRSDLAVNWYEGSKYPRMLADINGDGLADILGFGEDSVVFQLASVTTPSNGRQFAQLDTDRAIFSHGPNAGGLSDDNFYPRLTGDVNGDGHLDLIAAGDNGMWVALGSPDFLV